MINGASIVLERSRRKGTFSPLSTWYSSTYIGVDSQMVEIIGLNGGREHTVQFVQVLSTGSEWSLFSERQFYAYESTTEFLVPTKNL
jgi:hypothetical protein